MASFTKLEHDCRYSIEDPETGSWITEGISGCDAMISNEWPEGAPAYDVSACKCDIMMDGCNCTPYEIAK